MVAHTLKEEIKELKREVKAAHTEAHEEVSDEIKELKAEIRRLKAENKRLQEAAESQDIDELRALKRLNEWRAARGLPPAG